MIEIQPNDKGQVGAVHIGTTAPLNTDLLWIVKDGSNVTTDRRFYDTGLAAWVSLVTGVAPFIDDVANLKSYNGLSRMVNFTRSYGGKEYHFLMKHLADELLEENGYDLVISTGLGGHWRAVAKTSMMFEIDLGGSGGNILQHPFVWGHEPQDFLIQNNDQNYASLISAIDDDRIQLSATLYGPLKIYLL